MQDLSLPTMPARLYDPHKTAYNALEQAKLTKIEDTAPATPWNFSGCEEDKKIAAMVNVKSMPSVPQIMEGKTSDQ